MTPIYRIDPEGFYIFGNDAVMNDGDTPPADYITEEPPRDYVRPRYVNGKWIDVNAMPPEEQPEPPKTIEQRLDEIEARLSALEGN